MKGLIPLVALLALLIVGPLLCGSGPIRRPRSRMRRWSSSTPHNEATRYEFDGPCRGLPAKTGRTVFVDWRTSGGTSEIARYVAAQYLGSFRNYWINTLHRAWTPVCLAFDDPKSTGTEAMAVREAFLASNAGCGIDLFFGGGSFDYIQMANAGRFADSGVVARIRSFSRLRAVRADANPRTLGGEPLWDPKGLWIGACLGAFGICSNTDSLARLGIAEPPAEWSDLANPLYAEELALADPTQSGSVAKAFE